MKQRFFLLCLLSFFSASGQTQFFSGELEYTRRIIPKIPGLNVDSITALEPEISEYWITQGYYKTMYSLNGKNIYAYTYHGDTKRMFDEVTDKDYITFRDSRKSNNVRIRSIVFKDSTKTIAGYQCFMVERVYANYISKSYYAFDLRIDADSFKDHATGDWYFQIKEVNGALSMGSVLEYATHYEIHEVVSVTERALKPIDFALPPNKVVVASAEALDAQVEFDKPSNETIICYQQKLAEKMEKIVSAEYTAYVGFIVTTDGKIKHVEPYEQDEQGFHKVATDIVSNCGLKFRPGKINGVPVDSWVYFPIQFKK